MPKYKKIAVAIDFSEQSLKALKRAIQIAKENQSKLLLVNVVDIKSFGSLPAYDLKYAEQLAKENEGKLEKLKEEAVQSGVENVETVVVKNSAKSYLTSLPDISLIVCGATGMSKLEKALLGSVAGKIVRYSKCDVLVVRND